MQVGTSKNRSSNHCRCRVEQAKIPHKNLSDIPDNAWDIEAYHFLQ